MRANNKRKHKRLRIDRTVRIPVHMFPKVPFIGASIPAALTNLSGGGMALTVNTENIEAVPARGIELKIHFRLPGRPLQQCSGVVTHSVLSKINQATIGIRFKECPSHLVHDFELMAADNDACDRRLEQSDQHWCLPTCAFFELCRKPIRPESSQNMNTEKLEIVLQTRE